MSWSVTGYSFLNIVDILMPQKVRVEYIINMIMSTAVAYNTEAYVKYMPTIVTYCGKTVSGVSLLVFLY